MAVDRAYAVHLVRQMPIAYNLDLSAPPTVKTRTKNLLRRVYHAAERTSAKSRFIAQNTDKTRLVRSPLTAYRQAAVRFDALHGEISLAAILNRHSPFYEDYVPIHEQILEELSGT